MTEADRTDDPARAASEESGARDDLDALLAEYAAGGEGQQPPEDGGAAVTEKAKDSDPLASLRREIAELKKEFMAVREASAASEAREAIDHAVKTIRDGLGDVNAPNNRIIKAYLNARADEDPRIAKAFAQRHMNPSGWSKVLSAIAKELREELTKVPDPKMSGDVQAVRAAAKGTTASTPDEDAEYSMDVLGSLSHAEFRKKIREYAAKHSKR